MLKAIKIRIYPNEEQIKFLNKQFGSCRFVYNECLEYKSNCYKNEHKSISSNELVKYIVQLKESNNDSATWTITRNGSSYTISSQKEGNSDYIYFNILKVY